MGKLVRKRVCLLFSRNSKTELKGLVLDFHK